MDIVRAVKSQVSQGLAVAILEKSGYRVGRLGIEEQLDEIKRLDAGSYLGLGLPAQLRSLPDLVVSTTNCDAVWLTEVKYRSRLNGRAMKQLGKVLREQIDHWPGTHTILFLAESYWADRGYIQDHLRVVSPDSIEIVQRASSPGKAWDQLPSFQDVFRQANTSEDYHRQADRIVPAIRSLALADEERDRS